MIRLLSASILMLLVGCARQDDTFVYCPHKDGDKVQVRVSEWSAVKATVHRVFVENKQCWYVVSLEHDHWHPKEVILSGKRIW